MAKSTASVQGTLERTKSAMQVLEAIMVPKLSIGVLFGDPRLLRNGRTGLAQHILYRARSVFVRMLKCIPLRPRRLYPVTRLASDGKGGVFLSYEEARSLVKATRLDTVAGGEGV